METKTKADAITDWVLFIFSYAIALIVLAIECICVFVYALFDLVLWERCLTDLSSFTICYTKHLLKRFNSLFNF